MENKDVVMGMDPIVIVKSTGLSLGDFVSAPVLTSVTVCESH